MSRMCCHCNERIVKRSKIYAMCECCFQTLDMDRYVERKPKKAEGPFDCERCHDSRRILERDAEQPIYMYVKPCPQCNVGGKL